MGGALSGSWIASCHFLDVLNGRIESCALYVVLVLDSRGDGRRASLLPIELPQRNSLTQSNSVPRNAILMDSGLVGNIQVVLKTSTLHGHSMNVRAVDGVNDIEIIGNRTGFECYHPGYCSDFPCSVQTLSSPNVWSTLR